MTTETYAGVHCDIRYTDETDHHSVYISFGICLKTGEGQDKNGTPDGMVFYYADPQEWGLLATGQEIEGVDFVVIPETIEYEV